MFDYFSIILYFVTIMYGPFILLLLSIFFLQRGTLKSSSRLILVSFILFIPDILALLFLELEPILSIFLLLPVIQLFIYFRIRSKRTKVNMLG